MLPLLDKDEEQDVVGIASTCSLPVFRILEAARKESEVFRNSNKNVSALEARMVHHSRYCYPRAHSGESGVLNKSSPTY